MPDSVERTDRWSALSAIASRQHGVLTRGDLRACGIPPRTARDWVRRGLLVEHYRGAHALGHERLTLAGRRFAAVAACGPGAALGHRHGAAERGRWGGRLGDIHVTVPRGRGVRPISAWIHRCSRCEPRVSGGLVAHTRPKSLEARLFDEG